MMFYANDRIAQIVSQKHKITAGKQLRCDNPVI